MRWIIPSLLCSFIAFQYMISPVLADGGERPPNIVYIMCDELAYFELSHMGNSRIKTPTIDRMAKEGIRFTQALAAAPVCAPLRAALMTGKHMGHSSVRANGGGTPLRASEATIASVLKQKDYATGGFGIRPASRKNTASINFLDTTTRSTLIRFIHRT